MKLTFWGVRGSIPVPGPDTSRWGGNSSCVEINIEGSPPIVLDAGSGIRPLGLDLMRRPGRQLELLFTHFHMDHLLGFPFFNPVFAPSYNIRIHVPSVFGAERECLSLYLNGIFHPLRVPMITANLRFHSVVAGQSFSCGGATVKAVPLNHPGGAFAYRIDDGRHSVVYVTDTSPLATPDSGVYAGQTPTAAEQRLIEFLDKADLVIFDTMFTFDEYLERMTWGHSFPEYAVALARVAGVRQLYLFHHSPESSDVFLDELSARWAGHTDPVVRLAREGGSVDLEG